ncbi:MAG: sigma-54 dependent transcriptional regulator [Bacteroidota bacterium]|nr:sigma-54 dependent transcriptional regulator [Bacteroidota bacterium]
MNSTPAHVLVVDDEADLRLGLTCLVEETGARVSAASSAEEALRVLRRETVDVIISDIKMSGLSGVDLLHTVRRNWPATEVVLLTGFGSIELAVQCLQDGAAHFFTKPFDNDEIVRTVRQLAARSQARTLPGMGAGGDGVIAVDAKMRAVLSLVEQVAGTRVPVLIEGESGTGKEVIARLLHRRMGVEKPLVAVNCAAIPDTLLESELFGYRKGAFTGAEQHYEGIFRRAHRSTLFLDELPSMSPAFQGKLLRVLQEKVLRPLGAETMEEADFRLIAAGNRKLQDLVTEGSFREDLYYRLNVFTIQLPHLRERPDDILPLAHHFLAQAVDMHGMATTGEQGAFRPETVAALQQHAWPGNVRELSNVIQRAVILASGGPIEAHHLAFHTAKNAETDAAGSTESYEEAKQRMLEHFQRRFLERVLESTNGNISHAAEDSGLTRAAIQKMMRRLNIDRARFDHR